MKDLALAMPSESTLEDLTVAEESMPFTWLAVGGNKDWWSQL